MIFPVSDMQQSLMPTCKCVASLVSFSNSVVSGCRCLSMLLVPTCTEGPQGRLQLEHKCSKTVGVSFDQAWYLQILQATF